MRTLPSITHCSGVGICCTMLLQNSLIVSMLSLRWMKSLSDAPCSSLFSSCLLSPSSASLTSVSGAAVAGTATFLSTVGASWFSECNFATELKTLSGLCSSPSSLVSKLMERERTAWRARFFDLRETETFCLFPVLDNLQQSVQKLIWFKILWTNHWSKKLHWQQINGNTIVELSTMLTIQMVGHQCIISHWCKVHLLK